MQLLNVGERLDRSMRTVLGWFRGPYRGLAWAVAVSALVIGVGIGLTL